VWVKRVETIACACFLGAVLVVVTPAVTPPSLMRVAVADDSSDEPGGDSVGQGAAVEADVPAPPAVAATALLPSMDPTRLTQNADGSLVYHGTTAAGVETPGWSVIAHGGEIQMVHGPVAPAPTPALDATAEPAAVFPQAINPELSTNPLSVEDNPAAINSTTVAGGWAAEQAPTPVG
jgi:hypothetical protein